MLWKYLLKRLGAAVLLALGVIVVTFCLTSLLPGDPTTAQLGDRAAGDPEVVAAFRSAHGLDKPVYLQFLYYVGDLSRGDLGESLQSHRPVREDLRQFGPASAELAIAATIVAVALGVGLGVVAALRRDGRVDQILRVISLGGVSIPIFWLSLVATFIFGTGLGWTPTSGRLYPGETPPSTITGMFTLDALVTGNLVTFGSALRHLVLPAVVLSLPMVGLLLRFTRSSVLEVMGNDYVRAAYAKGLPSSLIVRRHVLRAALVPIITVVGSAFASLLAGTVLVEQIFSWPGIGAYAFRSSTNLDLPAIVGVTLFIALVFIVVNAAVDLAYGLIDPRIRTAAR